MKVNLILNPGHGIKKSKVKMMYSRCECKRILLQKHDKKMTRS